MIKTTMMLFDVDGTLTPSRHRISIIMTLLLKQLQQNHLVCIVGGSDYQKQRQQLGNVVDFLDNVFSENGVVVYKNNQLISSRSIASAVDEAMTRRLINFCLHYIADLDIPIKRGTFIEYRNSMINISPIGRNCSQEERDAFEIYDQQHGIRTTMVSILKQRFGHHFSFAIGGQISIDAYPCGWDKTYCLNHIDKNITIHFFGDKTEVGGNDHALYSHPRVHGHAVKNPHNTGQLLHQWIQHIDIDKVDWQSLQSQIKNQANNDLYTQFYDRVQYEMHEAWQSGWITSNDADTAISFVRYQDQQECLLTLPLSEYILLMCYNTTF